MVPRPKGRMYLKDRKKARVLQNDATQACRGQIVYGIVG